MHLQRSIKNISNWLIIGWWLACAIAIGAVLWQTQDIVRAEKNMHREDVPKRSAGKRTGSTITFSPAGKVIKAGDPEEGVIVFSDRAAFQQYFRGQYSEAELNDALIKALGPANAAAGPELIEVYKRAGKEPAFSDQYNVRVRDKVRRE